MKFLPILIVAWAAVVKLSAQTGDATPEKYKQLTNIPTIYIETYDHEPILSKTTYKLCRLIRRDSTSVEVFDSVKIRGRGNASWNFPKKPYRIKFAKAEKFLGKGHAKAKNWTLLSNGGEKLMLRNALNSYVGSLAGLKFNPSAEFTDLYINGAYNGTYQVSDHIDIRPHRVNIAEQEPVAETDYVANITGGYLMEVDGYTDEDGVYFRTPSNANIRIHKPDADVIIDRQKNYIKNFMTVVDNKLFSDNYRDEKHGYRQYFDSTSLLGWYLSSEIGSNFDLFHSTYFYKEKDDNHLFLGPLWDNDLGYNHDSRYGDETKTLMANVAYGNSKWFQRIRTDSWFQTACANHFNAMYEHGLDSLMLHYVDSMVERIHASVDHNFQVWNIRAVIHHDMVVFSTYDEYVTDIKKFIVEHNAFLYKTFNRLKPSAFVYDEASDYQFYNQGVTWGVISDDSTETATTRAALRQKNDGDRQQLWTLKLEGEYYTITNAQTGMALTDRGTVGTTKTLVTLELPVEGDETQKWKIVPLTMGNFNLQNASTKNILTNFASRPVDGNPLYGYTSNNLDSINKSRLWGIRKVERKPTAIQQIEARQNYLLIYNDASQTLRFKNDENEGPLVFRAMVYNINGEIVGTFRADEAFDMSNHPAGTYIVSWNYGGKSHSTKFLRRE